jgi:hypothetical protein
MPEDALITDAHAEAASRAPALIAVAGFFGVLFAGAGVLWAHYGTAVFFETIRAGFAACFG